MKITKYLTKPISKILKFLLRRLVFVTVAIILQLIWMTYLFIVIGEYSKIIEWIFRIFSIFVVIYIANKDDNPAYKLAWTIPILLFPIFGGFLYLVLGDKQPAKKLRFKLEKSIHDTEFLLGRIMELWNIWNRKIIRWLARQNILISMVGIQFMRIRMQSIIRLGRDVR